MKRQRWTRGAVVVIPLGDGFHAYGQMLDTPEYAFFDSRTTDEWPAEKAAARPVLFRLWVMGHAHSKGRWAKIGDAPVSAALQSPVRRFNQDALRPQDIRLTYDGCDGPLGTLADCEGLECAAVWDPEHVEDRLRAHYAGIPCQWTLSLRPKPVPPKE
ncbi:Imm26 family immunity protein [Zavarzinella formosa]|uniref:Imm26 family immunity protein n=1 Tax=Zavarzinella formosa TaxID=360055 RepID=UPI000907905A|nr:Imm26 family immunity protein [Zavarzinella formosa]